MFLHVLWQVCPARSNVPIPLCGTVLSEHAGYLWVQSNDLFRRNV